MKRYLAKNEINLAVNAVEIAQQLGLGGRLIWSCSSLLANIIPIDMAVKY